MKFSKKILKSYQEQLNWESTRTPVRTPSTRPLPFAVTIWGHTALLLQMYRPSVKDVAISDQLGLLGSAMLPFGREHLRALTHACFMGYTHTCFISHGSYEQVENIMFNIHYVYASVHLCFCPFFYYFPGVTHVLYQSVQRKRVFSPFSLQCGYPRATVIYRGVSS